MADVKISALPAVPVAVATTDLFAIVQGGVTYKATLTEVVTAITSTGLTATAGVLTVNLSTGVAGGQSVIGGTAASNNLTLSSTSNATKGKILFGTSAYDEANNRLGIGTASPLRTIHLSDGNNVINDLVDSSADFFSSKNSASAFTLSVASNTSTSRGVFSAFRSRGTLSAPSPVQSGDFCFALRSGCYDGSQLQNTAIINFISESNASSGNAPQYIQIQTGATEVGRTTKFQLFSNGNLILQNGGTFSDAGFRLDVNGTARIQGDFTISTKNIITDTTTGTKIGTATTQKLGFWNAAPIAQPTTAVAAATLVGGVGTNLTDTDTFDGYTLQQVVKALRVAGLLA